MLDFYAKIIHKQTSIILTTKTLIKNIKLSIDFDIQITI